MIAFARYIRLFSVAALVLVIAGCGPRQEYQLRQETGGVGAMETVLAATTRVFSDGRFLRDRSERLGFYRLDVSVPPNREPGEIETSLRRPDPTEHFLTTRIDDLGGSNGFRAALRAQLTQRPGGEVMLFVHGYNNEFIEGVYRTAQIRHDFDVPGVAVHYSWPSAGNLLNYAYDNDSALFARDGLERLIIDATAVSSNVVLVAHSMGAEITMEALRQLRIAGRQDIFNRISGVILMSPDIDIDVFRSQARRVAPLPQPFVIFTSRRDRALTISALITGQLQRLGTIGQAEDVAEFQVTLIDMSEFESASDDRFRHFTAISSPGMVLLLQQLAQINLSFENAPQQQLGLLPGTILTVQNATRIILSPLSP